MGGREFPPQLAALGADAGRWGRTAVWESWEASPAEARAHLVLAHVIVGLRQTGGGGRTLQQEGQRRVWSRSAWRRTGVWAPGGQGLWVASAPA